MTTSDVVSPEEIREILRGAVDLYVHSNPELLPRRLDDLALAREMHADGFRAAVMRNQFAPTGERAQIAKTETGFDIRGAIGTNGTVGGLNPVVLEHGIRMGACYVSMPTMSGSKYQTMISDYAREASTLAGLVPVTDESGKVLPQVHDVLEVVAAHGVVLNLGYLLPADYFVVLAAAREHRVQKMSATNTISVIGLSLDQIAEVMAVPGVVLEFSCSFLRPDGAGFNPHAAVSAAAITRFGAKRCVLASDTGGANDDTSLELFMIGCKVLLEHGISINDLRTMVFDTPSDLLGISS